MIRIAGKAIPMHAAMNQICRIDRAKGRWLAPSMPGAATSGAAIHKPQNVLLA